jgi:hypothetical protein
MSTLFYLIFFGVGVLLGLLIHHLSKSKCNHKWNFIDGGNVVNVNGKVYGIYKFYECEHCQKMKNEQINLN